MIIKTQSLFHNIVHIIMIDGIFVNLLSSAFIPPSLWLNFGPGQRESQKIPFLLKLTKHKNFQGSHLVATIF